MSVFRNAKVIILIAFLVFGLIIIASKGLKFGLDFSGGTQFILTLSEPVTDAGSMDKIKSTIAQRMDWTGLKDVKVTSWDEKFVGVQIAASDPKEIAQIEELLQKQGKFESIFEGKVLFVGDDIVSVSKDAEKGYGIRKETEEYSWAVPFTLNAKAARTFSEGIFHKCISLPDGTASCPNTFFFIDRPTDALVLIPKDMYEEENYSQNNTKVEDIFKNADVPFLVVDTLDTNTIKTISAKLLETKKTKIIFLSTFDIAPLKDANLGVTFVEVPKREDLSWVWSATGLKTIIGLREDITNNNAPTVNSPNFNVFMNLAIEGRAAKIEDAQKEITELSAILSSGSLPVGIENISKETVSPIMGQNILSKILIVGFFALLIVAIIIFVRYRDWRVALPIFFTGASEVFLIIAFASIIGWQLDLAAIAGILAAVGTGVDDQIIITDELERKKEGEQQQEERSLLTRVKRAFFIIWLSAATLAVTMLPLIFLFNGIPKLVGFAITTLAGVAIGVFVTRPAYAVILKAILSK